MDVHTQAFFDCTLSDSEVPIILDPPLPAGCPPPRNDLWTECTESAHRHSLGTPQWGSVLSLLIAEKIAVRQSCNCGFLVFPARQVHITCLCAYMLEGISGLSIRYIAELSIGFLRIFPKFWLEMAFFSFLAKLKG